MLRDMDRAGLSPRTQEKYIEAIVGLAKFHRKAPDQLTPDELRDWADDMARRGLSPSSQKIYLSAAKFLYRRTLFRPDMAAFLVGPRVTRRLPNVLSPSEVERVLAALYSPKYRMFFCLIYDTGLRVSEAAHLKAGDIDAGRGIIRIWQGKGSKDRQVKLGQRLLEMLRAYWRDVRLRQPHEEPLTRDSFLFTARTGGHIGVPAARAAINRAARAAGIGKPVSPHALRHAFATAQLEAGTDLRVVQAQLGHTDIHSTQVYLHVSTRLIRQAPSPLDDLNL